MHKMQASSSLNRTIIGLKDKSLCWILKTINCLNRTIIGLKVIIPYCAHIFSMSLNRTIIGLKENEFIYTQKME